MIVAGAHGGHLFASRAAVEVLADGTKRGVNTEVYTTMEIERVAAGGFDLARKRQGQAVHRVRRPCDGQRAAVARERDRAWRCRISGFLAVPHVCR